MRHFCYCKKRRQYQPLAPTFMAVPNLTIFGVDENEASIIYPTIKQYNYTTRISGPITKDGVFKPDGYNTLYTKHDEIYQIGQFTNGSLTDGKSFQYDENGLLKSILLYRNGVYISNANN